MDDMRLALTDYNSLKECKSCTLKDENTISGYILAFQMAKALLDYFNGSWDIQADELRLELNNLKEPIRFKLSGGILRYESLRIDLVSRYIPDQGIKGLWEEIREELRLPSRENRRSEGVESLVFDLIVKLVEIFHARCGLEIYTTSEVQTWEIRLCEEGLTGWLNRAGLAWNRLGDKLDLVQLKGLRPEKMATKLFGFYRFCRHYQS